jgi:phage terminase large subunit GpA-like protein
VKIRERNEALDLEVYRLAALNIPGPQVIRGLPQRAARLVLAAVVTQPEESALEPNPWKPVASSSPRRRGWVGNWRF